MNEHESWCLVGPYTPAFRRAAQDLLARGARVAVVTDRVAELALLVNQYADAILTIEDDLTSRTAAARTLIILDVNRRVPERILFFPTADASIRAQYRQIQDAFPAAQVEHLDTRSPMRRSRSRRFLPSPSVAS